MLTANHTRGKLEYKPLKVVNEETMIPLVLKAEQIKVLQTSLSRTVNPLTRSLRLASPNLKLMTAALFRVTRGLSLTQNQKNTACFSWKIKH